MVEDRKDGIYEEIRQQVRDFAEKEVRPIAHKLDIQDKEIPWEIIRKMADLGYFGILVPQEWGGLGLDYMSMAIAAEELSRVWLSVGSVMTRNIIAETLLLNNGTEEQKKRYLPGLATGKIFAAAAFTEPNAGSDTAGMKLRAEKVKGGWILSGTKTWCTFANRANILVVLARTTFNPSKRHQGLSIFIVEKDPSEAHEGIKHKNITGELIETVGYHGMHCWTLHFEDCFVPEENLIGMEPGKGFYQLMQTYESARIQTAARAVGVAQGAFDLAVKYSKERYQFEVPISSFQLIRAKLAKMLTYIEAARQLTYYACRMKDTGKRCDLEAGMAKLYAAEMVEYVTSEAMQIFGGYGYSKEYEIERYWRDGRIFKIFEGTSEIQEEVIAKRILEIY
ncbi:MAG: acyl-CoA dehydrogenase family protein [Candidatus Calescibacterium sp.]|nr:acyl-CoA dehydrogenase family protein [Candidatus Calescibacterium sp.]MCX7734915.1 acyl-CoA dehydrogenase family protein [bacterium]